MDRKEKNNIRRQLLEARDKNDVTGLEAITMNLISKENIEWDLVTIVLSSIPKLTDAEHLFETMINKIQTVSTIPEAAYTCILSDYAFYKQPNEALLWLERMKKSGIAIRNRHIVSLLKLAESSSNKDLLTQLNSLLDIESVPINQKVRAEQIMLYGSKCNEAGLITSLRDLSKTDRYILDPSIIKALQQNPSWQIQPFYVKSNQCSSCHTILKKLSISENERQLLIRSIEGLTKSSYKREQQFKSFKNQVDAMNFNVVIDGANVGFANANNKENSKNGLFLNSKNIVNMVDEFESQHCQPLVILHNYHRYHLRKSHQEELLLLEKLHASNQLIYVNEGSNDDWYWLYASLAKPGRYIVSNDQMRDHLFHAEEEEQLFRRFKEESQITYFIPPNAHKASEIRMFYPLPYSTCVQETSHGFHLPLGHMEKSSFQLDRWYCLRNRMTTLSQIMKKIR